MLCDQEPGSGTDIQHMIDFSITRASLAFVVTVILAVFHPEYAMSSTVQSRYLEAKAIIEWYDGTADLQKFTIQNKALSPEFSMRFRTLNDLSGENLGQYLKEYPSDLVALRDYFQTLSDQGYLTAPIANRIMGETVATLSTPDIPVYTSTINVPQSQPTLVQSYDYDSNSESEIVMSSTDLTDSKLQKEALEVFLDVAQQNNLAPLETVARQKLEETAEREVKEGLGSVFDTIEFELRSDSDDITTELQGLTAHGKEDERSFWFNQTGIIHEDGRTTINLGVGHRTMTSDNRFIYGVNAFYDHEFPNNHQRGSVGAELISTPFQITGNAYESISGYKSDRDGGEAKPASGYDYKFSVAMPYLPGITASIEQFKWRGEDGARDSKGQRLGITGNLSQNFSLAYLATDYDASTQSDDEEVRLTYTWSPHDHKRPTLVDVSDKPFEFGDVSAKKYQLVDRENRIIKQRKFSVIVEAI